ncbi:MAG TPA: hypothetical protein VH331_04150 [Allosphingosinicella sp.]|jgi:hypothetical protein|nr:hypothetical protein [Allosphingosinicella sp.]
MADRIRHRAVRPLGTTLAFALSVGAATGALAQEGQRFRGGPFDGLLVASDGRGPAGPSLPNASPVLPDQASIVGRLVAALSTGDRKALKALGPAAEGFCLNANGQPCDAAERVRNLPFKQNCRLNTPFFLGAYNGRVRLEWVCGQSLTYVAYANVQDGKLVTLVSWNAMPVAVIRK